MSQELQPCPFCGAGQTMIHVNKGTWNGSSYGEPVSVEVRHWCEETFGQPARMISRVGRDEASAIAAWNQRAQPAGEAVAWHIGNPDGTMNKLGAIYQNRRTAIEHFDSYGGDFNCRIVPLYAAPPAAANQAGGGLRRDQEAAYNSIDRFLRNNLCDEDYAQYSAELDSLLAAPHPTESHALGGGD